MGDAHAAVKISEHVWWVGAIDWSIRDFHGYHTDRGSTYNAYLIQADDIILVDTVKAPFRDELMARIASAIGDPKKIRYIISNHAETDHSGSLADVVRAVEPEKVFASKIGVEALTGQYDIAGPLEAVADGQKMTLGGVNLEFMESRMLHWPDSMFTYLADDRLLFSQDGFSMHLATSERWHDEIDEALLDYEAKQYYANILMPYDPIVKKAVAKVREKGWAIDVLAPDHGPVFRGDGIRKIIGMWDAWADQKPANKAIVVFATMWQNTARMGHAIGEGLAAGGADARVMDLAASHRSDVATEALDAGAIIVGSPTLNNNMFPTVADTLTYLKGLKPRNKIGAAFGVYGWSGEAVGQIEGLLREMRVDILREGLKVKYSPKAAQLDECKRFGLEVAAKLKEITGGAALKAAL
jgi:flavorubredoxin